MTSPGRSRPKSRGSTTADAERVHAESRQAWRDWLADNHTRTTGVWLVSNKAHTGKPRMTYEESVEEALCFGWIDSVQRTVDDERAMLWFSPRRKGSGWSRPNKLRIERLQRAGLLRAAGRRAVEAAKTDGSWNALDEVENLVIPEHLGAALDATSNARRHFEAFPRSVRRGILEWIATAKRPETRQRRVGETAQLAERNERANQWRPNR